MYLQNAVAVLPASPEAERAPQLLRKSIGEMGGSVQSQRAEALSGQDEAVGAFNGARDEEYDELLGLCRDIFAAIEAEAAAEHFPHAELGESDEDLAKLLAWRDKIRARDRFGAARQGEAEKAVEECGTALEGFAERVYSTESTRPDSGV